VCTPDQPRGEGSTAPDSWWNTPQIMENPRFLSFMADGTVAVTTLAGTLLTMFSSIPGALFSPGGLYFAGVMWDKAMDNFQATVAQPFVYMSPSEYFSSFWQNTKDPQPVQ
jgi:hypothetical protein